MYHQYRLYTIPIRLYFECNTNCSCCTLSFTHPLILFKLDFARKPEYLLLSFVIAYAKSVYVPHIILLIIVTQIAPFSLDKQKCNVNGLPIIRNFCYLYKRTLLKFLLVMLMNKSFF